MTLDFSKCQTKEDVEKVMREQGKAPLLGYTQEGWEVRACVPNQQLSFGATAFRVAGSWHEHLGVSAYCGINYTAAKRPRLFVGWAIGPFVVQIGWLF